MNKNTETFSKEKFGRIIDAILTADEEARKETQKARNEQVLAEQNISAQTSKIRSEYLAKAEKRISAIKESEDKRLALSEENIDKLTIANIDRLEVAAAEKIDMWADEIFRRTVSD